MQQLWRGCDLSWKRRRAKEETRGTHNFPIGILGKKVISGTLWSEKTISDFGTRFPVNRARIRATNSRFEYLISWEKKLTSDAIRRAASLRSGKVRMGGLLALIRHEFVSVRKFSRIRLWASFDALHSSLARKQVARDALWLADKYET